MILKRVDFIQTCRSQYKVLNDFTKKLFEAFARLGLNCRLLAMENLYTRLKEDPPDLTVAFNGVPTDPVGRMTCDWLHIPHLACIVDPSYRFIWLCRSPYIIIACDDRTWCQYLHRKGFTRTIFMPHATAPELYGDPCSKRMYDVVMLGTFVDFETRPLKWKSIWGATICHIMEEAALLTLSDLTTTYVDHFQALNSKIQLSKVPLKELDYQVIYMELEMYLKAKDRLELLKSIHDVEIHIFGSSIEKMDWTGWCEKGPSNITVHPQVEFNEAIEIMKKTKILLNPNIKNKQGSHERLLTGLACGALVLTNENAFLRETFQDGQSLAFYKNYELDQVNAKVTQYVKNDEMRQQVVKKGQEIVKSFHTWDNRAKEILRDIEPLYAEIQKQKSRF